jgi:hypothetical protein
MSFNRKIWLQWKIRKPCPTCSMGTLIPQKDKGLIKDETEESKEKNSYGGYYCTEYIFSIHLKCTNCSEIVAVSGLMTEDNYPEEGDTAIITPISFFPAPKIIEIPRACPKSVTKILNESFGLYWLDVSSCANKIRISIEVLLNELNVPDKKTINKKEQKITLHGRINEFTKANKDVGEFLSAIKWIGNAGSHLSEITRDNVLDAYELLDFSLELLYSEKKEKLLALSKKINEAKKPAKK